MKFGKEYASQMLPEWQEAYMDYVYLKTLLKDIQRKKQSAPAAAGLKGAVTTVLHQSFSGLMRGENNYLSTSPSKKDDIENQFILVSSVTKDGSQCIQTTFLNIAEEGGECDREFFTRLDNEFNKVDQFYRFKVQEAMAEAETLSKQMEALIAFRIKAKKLEGLLDVTQPAAGTGSKRIAPVDLMKSDESNDEISEQQINNHEQEQNNRSNIKQVPLQILNNVKLNKTLDTPSAIIKGFVNVPKKTDADINKENLKKVERQLKQAFVEFYRKIRHLKSYSFMNVLAFSKIMKKYDKITSRKASVSYMKMVDDSYLGSSDEVTKLMDKVEAAFVKYFSNSNRSEGMEILRPKAKKEKHSVSFTLGLFAGCSFALVLALIVIIHVRDIFDKNGTEKYMENMFPLYSLFGFIVLHMLMYAANTYFWKRYRVNYSFIFGLKQGTELGYRDVLLFSFGLAVLALATVLSNLDMEMDPETNDYKALTELLPLGLILLIIVIMICPLNIIYRSSRFFFLTCLFHCLFAPLYKVSLRDFILADQLTSQVQAFRSLEFYICYYGWGDYKHRENSCSLNDAYKTFYYLVAAFPYFTRLLQCLRRFFEERDAMHGYNGLKYFLIIVAINTRTAYSHNKEISWRIIAGIFSAIATLYCIYWDLVIDWGLLQRRAKNRWLRDKLLVPNKSIYFVAMGLNVLLRFAWLQTVLDLRSSFLHAETLTAIVACLEIIRRGIWNFFRLENEHLNNVGKYRAFKSVPLPFTYCDDEDNDE